MYLFIFSCESLFQHVAPRCGVGLLSSCGARTPHDFSRGAQAPGPWASVVAARGFGRCSTWLRYLWPTGLIAFKHVESSNPHLLHCQMNSHPLHCQGSPRGGGFREAESRCLTQPRYLEYLSPGQSSGSWVLPCSGRDSPSISYFKM